MRRDDSTLIAKTDFNAASANIHQHRHLSIQLNTFLHGQMNQSGLFFRADYGNWDSVSFRNQSGKRFAIFSFTKRTGGYSFESGDGVLAQLLAEAAKRFQCRFSGGI